jgi:glutathione S-transferase
MEMTVELILYNNEFCPECRAVREKMGLLQLAYYCVNVTPVKDQRQNVIELTGQHLVPVLVDDGKVFALKDVILTHLTDKYGDNPIESAACDCKCT